mgnify:CR=1 FL=1|tara:strand:+ start:119 stop:478 length:360 start_codon:yes stop_codon:yes gene_type:complete
MSDDTSEQGSKLMSMLKTYWSVAVVIVGVVTWIVTQAVAATQVTADVRNDVDRNGERIEAVEKSVESHEDSVGHQEVSDRLTKLEVEVKHVNVQQTENFKDIKDTLGVMQQEIRELNRR